MASQDDVVFSMLLNDPAPIRQLNSVLASAIRPHLATYGPWRSGYGLQYDHFQVDVHISQGTEGIIISAANTSVNYEQARPSSVIIEELTNGATRDTMEYINSNY